MALFLLGFRMTEKPDVSFAVDSGSGSHNISIFQAEDGGCYVFLPSYAEMENVRVRLPLSLEATLDGVSLSDGMSCGGFQLERGYPLEIQGGSVRNLCFLRSGNVSTMFLNAAPAAMEWIHESKENTAAVEISILTETGEQDYNNEGCTIKGRGNATWYNDKKPYLITLPSPEGLLGMGSASKWVLLANAADMSNLHNKLALEFARNLGIGWTPRCEYVDVYLNGVYNGLYLLCEKIEAAENRLELDTAAGDFLCSVELNSRWDILENPVRTGSGRTVSISAPNILTEEETAEIRNRIDLLEQILDSGADLSAEVQFDQRSWIGRYLIDEIFENIDSDLASSYFYNKEGVFYAGPVWDYDMVLGNSHRNADPQAFLAKNLCKSQENRSVYYDALYRNRYFYEAVTEQYRTQCLPLLQQLVDTGIPQLEQQIAEASSMNSLRWKEMTQSMLEEESVYPTTAESIREYLRQRMDFLNRVWIEGESVCTVQYDPDAYQFYRSLSVPSGTVLTPQILDVTEEEWTALQRETGLDLSQPITEDMVLNAHAAQNEEEGVQQLTAEQGRDVATQDMIALASVGILVIFLICFIEIDSKNKPGERRKTDERSGTKISP